MVNKVILIGNMGKDPELRYTPQGTPVCNFSLAVVSGYGDKKHTEWVNIIAWKQTAEACAKYTAKGSKVYVEGRLQTTSWETVVAEMVKFLDSKGKGESKEQYEDSAPTEDTFLEPF